MPLASVPGRPCGHPADGVVAAMMRDVRAFRGDAEPFDDLTLLVARREAGA